MIEHRLPISATVALLLLALGALISNFPNLRTNTLQRRLRAVSLQKPSLQGQSSREAFWCSKTEPEPLPYSQCNADDVVYRIPLEGGMTTAMKTVLLGAILAFEENRCFFVDESKSQLNNFDRKNYHGDGFMSRYFEPIGLSPQHDIVLRAQAADRVHTLTWKDVLQHRRMDVEITSIQSLGYFNMKGHELKASVLKRLWRPLPQVREATCTEYWQVLGRQEFIALSIRRGDKVTENFGSVSLNAYIDASEEAIQRDFQGIPPPIFVATDDCTVMNTLRSRRPKWRFVTECDEHYETGFYLKDISQWSETEYDEHFGKFFVELYAMAHAKQFIGISYSSVSWFAYFMRGSGPDNFQLLDATPRQILAW